MGAWALPLLVEPLTNSYFQQKIITCLKYLTFFLCADAINLEVSDLHFNNNIFMWLTITSTCCICRVWSIYFTTHTLRYSLYIVFLQRHRFVTTELLNQTFFRIVSSYINKSGDINTLLQSFQSITYRWQNIVLAII